MAYSRWNGSDWYVFWVAEGTSTTPVRNLNPRLAMWYAGDESLPEATFEQLDGITEDALAALVPNAPRDAVKELMSYVHDFCADVRDLRAGGDPSRW